MKSLNFDDYAYFDTDGIMLTTPTENEMQANREEWAKEFAQDIVNELTSQEFIRDDDRVLVHRIIADKFLTIFPEISS